MDKYQPEIVKMLHSYGAWTRPRPTLPPGAQPDEPVGAADLMVHINGGCAVEVKTGYNNSFSLSEWRDNQREWAAGYGENTHNIYWLAIVVETEYSPWTSLRNKRAAFLVSRDTVLMCEEFLPQASIPYIAGKGINKVMQENKWDMKHLWYSSELIWNKGGWQIPTNHPFFLTYQLNQI